KRETGTRVDLVESMDSSDATLYATVHGGESFPDAELQRAENIARATMPGNVTAAQLARALRMAGMGRVLGTVTVPPPAKPLADTKHQLRRLIQTRVNRLA